MAGRRATHRRRNHRKLLITTAAVTAGLIASAIGITAAEGAKPDRVVAGDAVAQQVAVPSPAAAPLHNETPTPVHSIPAADPARGMVYTGLAPAASGDRCVGVYKVSSAGLCTHGPDAPPKDVDIHKATPPAAAAAAAAVPTQGDGKAPATADLLQGAPPVLDVQTGNQVGAAAAPAATATPRTGSGAAAGAATVVCDGDGTTGNRVQVLYVHAPGQDRFAQYLPSFKKWASDVDVIYNASAAETGGVRHVRFVTEPDCSVSVLDVELSASALQEFGATNDALAAQGFNHRDRKYMMFADTQVYCGIGTFAGDERSGQDNLSNFGPSYGRTDNGCWSGSTAAHELGHNLGAVNNSAPHSTKAGHCTDTWDLMCYSDAPYYPQMQVLCPDRSHQDRLDCSKDDYFNTNPKPGSYLASHWNVANNQFLIKDGGSGPNPSPTPTPNPTPTGSTPTPTPSPSPTRPTTGPDVTVSQVTQNSAVLSWAKSDAAAGYDLQVGGRTIATVHSTVVRLVQLQPDTDYRIAVAVRDQSGHVSKPGRTAVLHTLASTGPVGPTTAGRNYVMINSLTGQAADLWGGSYNDGTVLIGYQKTGYANQQWQFEDAGDGYLRIKSARTQKCLQVGGPLLPGEFVMQQPCGNDDSQQWKLTADGSGYRLTAKGADLVLGTSDRWYYGGWLLELQQPDGQSYQNWTLQQAS